MTDRTLSELTEAQVRLVAAARWLEHAAAGDCDPQDATDAAHRLVGEAERWLSGEAA